APKCPVALAKRSFSQTSLDISELVLQDSMSPEDHVKRMKMLERHLAKVTDSFSHHFWPRQEDMQPLFNTFPRRRTDEINSMVMVEKKPNRRARGWSMIPTLLTFKSNSPGLPAVPELPDSPTLSTYALKRHLYPMGLSIGSTNRETSMGSSRDLSPIGSVAGTPECQSQAVSRTSSPVPASPPKSPVLSARSVSPAHERFSVHSQFSGIAPATGRPLSPAHKRGALGLYNGSNNDASTLADEFGHSLSIIPRQPLQSASSQSSGASSSYNVNHLPSACTPRQPSSIAPPSAQISNSQARQRKRKADEAGVVGKTKGGFEVVWSATDAMSTSYVMVPVPKTVAPESPAKMHKQEEHHRSRLTAIDGDTIGSHSQPNLKRVLESITREINLDSSYVLLLPPPPPVALGEDQEDDDDDEFAYLTTTVLRRVKSEIVMRRTLQEFEREYGLDRIAADDGDSDSFQMVEASDDASSRNSVYFSAEDDSVVEHETWYKRLSATSSQHHVPLARHRPQAYGGHEHDAAPYRPHPLSLNQLTLLEFFLDGMRRFYFTYRKGFPTITPSFYTSDMGWGCTYRTCQMMLAESFSRVLLSRFWDPFRLTTAERARHGRIIDWFHDADTPKAYYSIHRMARTATEMDKRIGDWLGPSIGAHVMKRLANKHPSCPLAIHVAIDQTVYASEVRKQGLSHHEEGAERPTWRPLLLLIPVRLGLSRLNLGYIPKIKTLFQIPQSVGLVGGKPSRSFYFIGRQGDNLFYLDPHNFEIGIIGAGDMGMLYARRFKKAGYVVNICDTPDRHSELQAKHGDLGLNILLDGYAVSRRSDFVIYSVPAVNIGRIVEEYGRATKVGAIVAGQTSVKTPEILAFEKYLPDDVHIVTCHSMHGPNIDTKGQPLAIIRYRSDDEHYRMAVEALSALESRVIYLTYEEHDRITADTQAATHLSFISLGTAWSLQGYHPWLNPQFISGINNVKVAMALRIYASKWHVYAGLAIMNPLAKKQLQCYVESMTTLYKFMVAGKNQEFRDLVHQAADFIFGRERSHKKILLDDDILDQLSLSQVPKAQSRPNSHLSLLSAAVCWFKMGMSPYDNLICQTPPFRMWLGIVEYLFCHEEMLEESIETALSDRYTQAEDLVFYTAVTGWGQCIELGSFDGYRERFEKTAEFLSHKLEEGKDLSTMIIKKLTDKNEAA
ncbi:prephenate dehydrogenase (NADP(+)), partial [Coemansia sp. RSA 2052]